ncbi:unnamed protein product [Prunus armeniaca]
MEELHAAALDYYSNGSPELQRLAWSFFQSMDTNNDGRISSSEFYEFLQQSGYSWIINDPSFFTKLDRNRDSGLDFYDVLTFYYIVKTRNILCQGCRELTIIRAPMISVLPATASGIFITTIRISWITMSCCDPNEAFLLVLAPISNKWFQAYRLFEIAVAAASAAANCTIM